MTHWRAVAPKTNKLVEKLWQEILLNKTMTIYMPSFLVFFSVDMSSFLMGNVIFSCDG
jgi:hypothetical protein